MMSITLLRLQWSDQAVHLSCHVLLHSLPYYPYLYELNCNVQQLLVYVHPHSVSPCQTVSCCIIRLEGIDCVSRDYKALQSVYVYAVAGVAILSCMWIGAVQVLPCTYVCSGLCKMHGHACMYGSGHEDRCHIVTCVLIKGNLSAL